MSDSIDGQPSVDPFPHKCFKCQALQRVELCKLLDAYSYSCVMTMTKESLRYILPHWGGNQTVSVGRKDAFRFGSVAVSEGRQSLVQRLHETRQEAEWQGSMPKNRMPRHKPRFTSVTTIPGTLENSQAGQAGLSELQVTFLTLCLKREQLGREPPEVPAIGKMPGL